MDLAGLDPATRAKVLLERLGKPNPEAKPEPKKDFDSDLIPQTDRSSEDQQIDTVVDSIDIVEAYERLIGKMTPSTKRAEGVMISCPLPNHPDKNPSAWINTDKKLWFCGGCQTGGDIYDFAAIYFNYDLANYKAKETFPRLRKQLAELYGFREIKGIAGKVYLVDPPAGLANGSSPDVKKTDNIGSPTPVSDNVSADILDFPTPAALKETLGNENDLRIDWEEIVPTNTFLRSWMEACTVDDLPHEYYFWLGLQALGFAAGTNILLDDFHPVKPNLYICLYGKTGVGKSRSIIPFTQLLDAILPYKGDDPYSDPDGVKIITSPNSAETLLDSFVYTVLDPTTNQPIRKAQVKGLLRIDEFSSIVSRASRFGSTLKPLLMDLYDVLNSNLSSGSRKSGDTIAKNPFCQIVTSTQPKAIHQFLRKTDAESGFLNRWILAFGTPRVAPIAYGHIRMDTSEAERALKEIAIWTRTERMYSLEDEARTEWEQFFTDNLAAYKSGQEDLDTLASRIDLILKKLILLFAINEQLDQPTADTVRRAVALYEYLTVTYSAFGRDIIFNEVTSCQQKIISVVDQAQKKKKKYPTRREINRALAGKYETDVMVKAFRHLIELDMIQEIEPDKSERSASTRYKHADA